MVPVCLAGRWKDKYLAVALPYSWNHNVIKDPLEQSVCKVYLDKQPSRLPLNPKQATSHSCLHPDSLLYPQTGKNVECVLIDSLGTPAPDPSFFLLPYLLLLHLSRAMAATPQCFFTSESTYHLCSFSLVKSICTGKFYAYKKPMKWVGKMPRRLRAGHCSCRGPCRLAHNCP